MRKLAVFPVNDLIFFCSGSAIYECNSKCTCGPDCWNRVVQLGSQVKLAIFKTKNGCGWGVKAKQKIKKGTFIMEYLGEVRLGLSRLSKLFSHDVCDLKRKIPLSVKRICSFLY